MDAPARGRKWRFARYSGCTEDHAAASFKAFHDLNSEAKGKALEDSMLCKFCLRHPADAECFGKGSASKPACKIPECKGQHAESLHEMMACTEVAVNSVVFEEEEEEGHVNLAKGEHWQGSKDS